MEEIITEVIENNYSHGRQEPYRYPGVRPFQDTKIDRTLFFGRKEEKNRLLHKILAERHVIMYAKSGSGKTSLLNAGIFQELRDREYYPFVVRLPNTADSFWDTFYGNITNSAIKNEKSGYIEEYIEGNKRTLWEFFKTVEFWSKNDKLLTPVLVLDQFEELFTLNIKQEYRAEFIVQFSDLIRGRLPRELREAYTSEDIRESDNFELSENPPSIKTVISIRESFFGQLFELMDKIPGIFDNPFRLESLNRDNAREAIISPAEKQFKNDPFIDETRFTYDNKAVDSILDFLCDKENQSQQNTTDLVGPSQLQILCSRIEYKIRNKKNKVVKKEDLGGKSGMQSIVQDFYNDEFSNLDKISKDNVQLLFEKGLLSDTDRRIPLDGEFISHNYNVDKRTLDYLIGRRLLSSEPKRNGFIYELAHDILVEPIRKSQRMREAEFAKLEDELQAEQDKRDKRFKAIKRILSFSALLIIAVLSIVVIFSHINLPYTEFKKGNSAIDISQRIYHYKKAIEHKSDYAEAYLFLGFSYLEINDVEKGEVNLSKAIDLSKNTNANIMNAHLAIGNIYNKWANMNQNNQNRKKAIEHYQIAKELSSKFPEASGEASARLAEAYKGQANKNFELFSNTNNPEDLQKVIESLESAIESNPKDEEAYYRLGGAYFLKNEFLEGVKYIKRAIDIDPHKVEYYIFLIQKCRKAGEIKEAFKEFEKQIQSKENMAFLYVPYANELLKADRYTDAISNYEKAIQKGFMTDSTDYDRLQILTKLGSAYSSLGFNERAIEHYKKALEYDDSSIVVLQGLGDAFFESKKYNKSIENYEKAIEIDKENPALNFKLGYALYKNRDFDKALSVFDRTLSDDVNFIKACQGKGLVLQELGNYAQAQKVLDKCKAAEIEFKKE